ncbi:MAG: hypothetical protein U0228_23725 [Myxococcaceae bacterium]
MKVAPHHVGRVGEAASALTVAKKTEPVRATPPTKWHQDGFEPPAKPKATHGKKKKPTRPITVSPALVDVGAAALARDRKAPRADRKDAGWLLGGITTAVVINVMQQTQQRPMQSLDVAVQRLAELCGALFLEFLARELEPKQSTPGVLPGHEDFEKNFQLAFGLTALDATLLFVDFLERTDGRPRERLRGSIYA